MQVSAQSWNHTIPACYRAARTHSSLQESPAHPGLNLCLPHGRIPQQLSQTGSQGCIPAKNCPGTADFQAQSTQGNRSQQRCFISIPAAKEAEEAEAAQAGASWSSWRVPPAELTNTNTPLLERGREGGRWDLRHSHSLSQQRTSLEAEKTGPAGLYTNAMSAAEAVQGSSATGQVTSWLM